MDWVKEACQHPVKVSGVPSDAVTCVYVGCCKGRPFKGLQLFIEAFGLIADTRAHMVLLVIVMMLTLSWHVKVRLQTAFI